MNDKQAARAERELLQRDALRLAAAAGIEVTRSMLVPLLVARGSVRIDANDEVEISYQSPFGDWWVDGPTVIREMRADPDFGPLFAHMPKLSAKSRERNPFARGPDFNLTEQMRLIKGDPTTAARLRAAAEQEATDDN